MIQLQFHEMSKEAQEVAKEMINFCLERGCCMGMEEGEDLETGNPYPYVCELMAFTEECTTSLHLRSG